MIKLDKIGSDPEFFIVDREDSPVGAFLFFEGTKHNPQDVGNGFAILKDNLLVEGNIPPASTRQEFIDNMEMLKALINSVLKPQKARIMSLDVMKYHEMWINTPDGLDFGCSQFKEAYSMKTLQTPMLEGCGRSAGFHIHISYKTEDGFPFSKIELNGLIAKAMDYFIGLPSDQIFYSKERRSAYGILGAFRDTQYGIEYRSLGGFFTKKQYLGWVYDQTVKAIEFCSDLSNLKLLKEVKEAKIENYEKLGINLGIQIPEKITV